MFFDMVIYRPNFTSALWGRGRGVIFLAAAKIVYEFIFGAFWGGEGVVGVVFCGLVVVFRSGFSGVILCSFIPSYRSF